MAFEWAQQIKKQKRRLKQRQLVLEKKGDMVNAKKVKNRLERMNENV